MRRAVIDIGTNSVKLLVADVHGLEVRPVAEHAIQTRLGQGFFETHRLQPGPIAKTAQAVADFARAAQAAGAASVRAIGTSAARDATNADELLAAIHHASGLTVEIISGEREADWAFHGATSDPALAKVPLLLLDVGGGSTEFIVGHNDHKLFRQSFRLGVVRLMEKIPHSDPPLVEELTATRKWLQHFLQREVSPGLTPALEQARAGTRQSTRFIGTGGTASILACMEAGLKTFDRERLEQTRLSTERLQWHVDHLWSLPLDKRKKVAGLPPERADVILTGAAIYEAVAKEFGFEEFAVSTRGLRFAAVMLNL